MKKRKLLKTLTGIALVVGLIGTGTMLYMLNKPHRDVLASGADYTLSNTEIVGEYLLDRHAANGKYLAEDGNSKILEITGTVTKISENFNSEKVVLLKEEGDKAGVSATFTSETNHKVTNLKVGEKITLKGVIRSGAFYDDDLELYENVILEKSDLITQ